MVKLSKEEVWKALTGVPVSVVFSEQQVDYGVQYYVKYGDEEHFGVADSREKIFMVPPDTEFLIRCRHIRLLHYEQQFLASKDLDTRLVVNMPIDMIYR